MFPGAFAAEDLTDTSRGRFREVVALSAGSTAAVFKAFDVSLGMQVAVKVSHGTLEANYCLREEHRLLTGPLASVAEIGRAPTACRCFALLELEGRVALVLEYLDPEQYQPLDDLGRRADRLTEHQALEILIPFFSLLSAAHELGIIYNDAGRDKAGHLLWDSSARQLKVIDWANAIDTTRASSTQTRRAYHDVVGCGELLLLMRGGAGAEEATPEEIQQLGEFGGIVQRCLNFADPDSFATAHPLEQAARQRTREIEREFAEEVARVQAVFATGVPHEDFQAVREGVARARGLIAEGPQVVELEQQLRSWTASLTAGNLLDQAEAELREGHSGAATQKLRLVLNLAQANPQLSLPRGEAALNLWLALCSALDEYPTLLPAGAVAALLDAGTEALSATASQLLRDMLDRDEVIQRRDSDPEFALDLLRGLADCAGARLWSAEVHKLAHGEGGWNGEMERIQALDELRRNLGRLERSRPSEDVWRDMLGCYEGFLDEVRAIQSADGQLLPDLDEIAERALVLARRAHDEWAGAAFTSSVGMLAQLRDTDIESRAAVSWVAHARAVEARWGFPGDQTGVPTALAWLFTEESPAAVAFLLRDAVNELESWAKSTLGARDPEGHRDPSYLESLRVLLEAYLRIFEYLGVPRQRHPAQKLGLRALVTCVGELESVAAVRKLGARLIDSKWDDGAWEFANESVQLTQVMDERRREQPIIRKIVGMAPRPGQEGPNSQLIDIVQRLTVASSASPLLGALVRLPEVRYQTALAYCETGDWDAARTVLGDLRIVGTRPDDTYVRATSLHRSATLTQASAAEARDGRLGEAILKLDEALHELDANPRFRHEFRTVTQLIKDRKTQLSRPDGPQHLQPTASG
ncbi:MAG: hypothetical protein HY534_07930 [Chloroflexi bacterium]|nr:hypothetical protein [Chloroflexota bacterium]